MPTVALPSNLYISVKSDLEQDVGTIVDFTDDGKASARRLADPSYSMTVRFTVINQAKQINLIEFLNNNATAELLVPLNGRTYAVFVRGKVKHGFVKGGRAFVEFPAVGRSVD